MLFEVHYSKKPFPNREHDIFMNDIWKFEKVEANNEDDAVKKLINSVGKEKVNYILSVTPL